MLIFDTFVRVFAIVAQAGGEPIVTDRPDFTESAIVVPSGAVQIELGATASWPERARSLALPEFLVRLGASRNLEARIGLPSWNSSDDGAARESGFGDAYLGLKLQAGPCHGIDLAFIPAVYLPTNNGPFSSSDLVAELKVAYSVGIDEHVTVSAMSTGLWTRGSSPQWGQTVSLGIALADQWGMFLEYAGTYLAGRGADHVAHFGFTFQPKSNQQFDVHFGFGLGRSREPFVGLGYAVRF